MLCKGVQPYLLFAQSLVESPVAQTSCQMVVLWAPVCSGVALSLVPPQTPVDLQQYKSNII